jgi:hypothetical protein
MSAPIWQKSYGASITGSPLSQILKPLANDVHWRGASADAYPRLNSRVAAFSAKTGGTPNGILGCREQVFRLGPQAQRHSARPGHNDH